MKRLFPWMLGCAAASCGLTATAQQTDITTIPDPDPAKELASFIVAEGFEVNLFASDPAIAKPIQMNFDSQGRLWVVGSTTYPQIKPGDEEKDRITLLEDADGDGVAEKATVFADNLLVPTGIAPGDGGVYAANSTEVLFLKDTDGDGKADERRVLLSGFGTEDTHHIIHTFRWGYDGLLYFNQSIYIHSHVETPWGPRTLNAGGIWQLDPVSLKMEVFVRGFVNPWGHHFDRWGQSFATDGAYGEGPNYIFPGAAFLTAQDADRILTGLNPGSPKHCSLEVLSGTHLPEDWRGNLITNDFRGHRVCRFVLSEDGTSGYASREMTELIKTSHVAFRPVDVKMGPDGAIYICDFYNPIIQHGEVDFRDERRDHEHGRIWRVTAKGRALVPRPKIAGAPVTDLLALLKAPEEWTRTRAKREMIERGADAVLPALNTWVKNLSPDDPEANHHRLEALWLHEGLRAPDPVFLTKMLRSEDYHVRAAAVRVVPHWLPEMKDALALLSERATDEHPRVRLEAVRALATINDPRAAEAAMRATDMPIDRWLDYALWLTARELKSAWLPEVAAGRMDFGGKPAHMIFAMTAANTPDVVPPLAEKLRKGAIPAELQPAAHGIIASLGGPGDLRGILDDVLKDAGNPSRGALLEALLQAGEKRNIRPDGDLAPVADLLRDANAQFLPVAVRACGAWHVEAAREGLGKLAADPRDAALQQGALDALAKLGGEASVKSLAGLAGTGGDWNARVRAAVALAGLDAKAAAQSAAVLLADAPAKSDPAPLLGAFFARKDGPGALADALKESKLDGDLAKVAVRTVTGSGRPEPALIAALTKAGGIEEGEKELAPEALRAMVEEVRAKGDAARGEAIFRRPDVQCFKCHNIAGSGGKLAPDMSSLGGSAQIDYIIESILTPNKAVKEGYHSVNVTTKDGDIVTGIKVRETGDALILRNALDAEVSVPLNQIAEQANGISLMPVGLADLLTHAELVDLVRFLSALGRDAEFSIKAESRPARTWRTLVNTPKGVARVHTNGFRTAALPFETEKDLTWDVAYSRVAGDLPVEELPEVPAVDPLVKLSFARADFALTQAGKATLDLGAADGLKVWIDDKPYDAAAKIDAELSAGTHTVTLMIDRGARKGKPVRAELIGGGQWVGGK